MRFRKIVFAVLGPIVAASLVVSGRIRVEGTRDGPQKEMFHVVCPLKLEAGPNNLPEGWQSLGNLFYQRRSITVDLERHLVVCWYGEGNPLPPYLIAQPIPAGYVCKVLKAGDTSFASFEAECRLSRRPNRRN